MHHSSENSNSRSHGSWEQKALASCFTCISKASECCVYLRGEETSLQSWYREASRDLSLQEFQASHLEAAFPELGERDCQEFQNRLEVSECNHWGLQEAGEAHLLGYLKILICAIHTKRVTFVPRDTQLHHQIQGERV
ncbi:PREDICTED: histone H3-like [Chinchilla lanigera]|uniref:histone H3-like n=1 Tax=Chinchilla lanigera TaxID=34839 RepID=UPI000699112A|nr:PREDICTED: histone H3-like [Chinchilla lanigera]